MAKEKDDKRSRPGGRSERIRKAVAESVLKLIGEYGLEFEIKEVSRLAGVGRATVFRRWPDRAALIGEALGEHVSRFSVELRNEWPEDLYRITADFREFMRDPVEMSLNRALLLTNSSVFKEQMITYWTPIFGLFQKSIQDAIARGEVDPSVDVEVVITAISEVLLTESIIESMEQNNLPERLVAQLIRGCPPIKHV